MLVTVRSCRHHRRLRRFARIVSRQSMRGAEHDDERHLSTPKSGKVLRTHLQGRRIESRVHLVSFSLILKGPNKHS